MDLEWANELTALDKTSLITPSDLQMSESLNGSTRPIRSFDSERKKSFLLNGSGWFVVRGSWFVVVVFYVLQYCSTDLLYMCGCAVNKTPGGPRAQEGTRTTGNTRALTHGHLKAAH